jgi:hypothetical protein
MRAIGILGASVIWAMACGGSGASSTDEARVDTTNEISRGTDATSEPDGVFTLYLIPPPGALDWTTPNSLLDSMLASQAIASRQVAAGQAAKSHSIGHVYVGLECSGADIPVTGQTDDGASELKGALDGMGVLFQRYPGNLDAAADAQNDIDKRTSSGLVRMMKFKVRHDTCTHLAGFLAEYVRREAYKNYGSQYRPRRWEGAGCSAFSLAFVEVAGLLRRSLYTAPWAHQVTIGLDRVADVGGDGQYDYASNLITHNDGARFVAWPKDRVIHVKKSPILPFASAWSGWLSSRDATSNPAPGEQPDAIPLTLYDPGYMSDFIDQVAAHGGGTFMGRTWTTRMEGKAPVIETDARDSVHAPYEDPTDDLTID